MDDLAAFEAVVLNRLDTILATMGMGDSVRPLARKQRSRPTASLAGSSLAQSRDPVSGSGASVPTVDHPAQPSNSRSARSWSSAADPPFIRTPPGRQGSNR